MCCCEVVLLITFPVESDISYEKPQYIPAHLYSMFFRPHSMYFYCFYSRPSLEQCLLNYYSKRFAVS